MFRFLTVLLSSSFLLAGCGAAPSPAPAPESKPATEAPAKADEHADEEEHGGEQTPIGSAQVGPFTVVATYDEAEFKNGHFNADVTGGEVAAVRMWVGPEDATGVMVAKAEIEGKYQHAHVEVPDPLPADAKLWIEIETPTGETHKGGIALDGVK